MFKIIQFKHLCIVSFILCFLFLGGAFLKGASPLVATDTSPAVTLPIVMYHQVTNQENGGKYILPIDELRADFQYFADNGINPVSFRQLEASLTNGTPLPQNPIIITFDDGARSFLTKVVPLLEEFNFPANVNIIGSLTRLYTENGDTNDSYAYLNEADIISLSQNPLVELGCHTYDLHSLNNRRGMAKLSEETHEEYIRFIQEDTEKFNDLFFSITGEHMSIFAYPFGIRNDLLPPLLKEMGYIFLLTSGERVNKITPGTFPCELGRFNRPYGIDREKFFSKLFPIANDTASVYN